MTAFLLAHEPWVRLACFAAVLAAMLAWEELAPRRPRTLTRARRWPANFAIVAVNTILVRIVFPTAAVGFAILAAERGFGLLNVLAAPAWIAIPLSILVLDLAIYGQHWAFHRVAMLWRLHRMHHADQDIDTTTGARFHPIEILLSMAIKLAIVALLGPPAVAVLVFEVLLNATSMFNHANVAMPLAVDRALRTVLVTPDMHRVHHSIVRHETDSNFGFNLSWWDRLFGTYRAQPAAGHDGMTIGIDRFRDPVEQRLDRMLTQPFRDDPAAPDPR